MRSREDIKRESEILEDGLLSMSKESLILETLLDIRDLLIPAEEKLFDEMRKFTWQVPRENPETNTP